MPHIVIDGQRLEAAAGRTVIEAAYENGMKITHFCWHPELSISGNCRMCLVEVGMPKRLQDGTYERDSDGNTVINYFPKLQIACATIITEDMHIHTSTEKVVKAQEAVMEFLLINHPLDCPICDEAGQCKLQEYAFMHSQAESRFEEIKVRKDKRQKWGPNVMFDSERCISCSRCVRFAQEVAHQDVLTFVNRGDHVTIKLFEDTQFDNPYSMNVIDICPVGALTSRDFRFKARVWDMSFNDSICPGCARGCNIKLGVRNNEILRVEPRTNMNVNQYWMCDYGRLTQYGNVNNDRITEPHLKINNEFKICSWDEAYKAAVDALSRYQPDEIMVLGSRKATTEDNYLLLNFARENLKTSNYDTLEHIDESFGDDFLKCSDLTPNSRGVQEIGFASHEGSINCNNLVDSINSGRIKALYSIDGDFVNNSELMDAIKNLKTFIIHSANYSNITDNADIILPSSTFAESEGTYINIEGRVQHFTPALTTKENLRIMGMKMSRLDKFGAHNDRWMHHEQRGCRQNWRIIQSIANMMGAEWNYKSSSDVFDEIAGTIELFEDMSYMLLDEYKGLFLSRVDNPEPKEHDYESFEMKPR